MTHDGLKHTLLSIVLLVAGAVIGAVASDVRRTVFESPITDAALATKLEAIQSDVTDLESAWRELAPTGVQIEALGQRIDDLNGAVVELSKETRRLAVQLATIQASSPP